MQVQEIATKHGIPIQKVLDLLEEVGVSGKEEGSALNESELNRLEERLGSRPVRPGLRGAVKVLRPSTRTSVIRRKPTGRLVPTKKTGEAKTEEEDEKTGRREALEKPVQAARKPEGRRQQAESKARSLLRAKRLRESGIGKKLQEQKKEETPEEEVKATEAPAAPVVEEKPPSPVTPKPAKKPKAAPKKKAAPTTEKPSEPEAEQAEPAIEEVAPAPPAEGAPPPQTADRKKGKSKKAKKEELIEASRERESRAQERKVLASIMGRKKGKKQQYKRTKRERFAAQEEAVREREERERTTLRVHEATTVADVAHGLGVNPSEILKILLDLGKIVTVNQRLDSECIELIAEEYGFDIEKVSLMDINPFEELDEHEEEGEKVLRPPVVTVMGHVDHGKTKLMDAIRAADVASGEAGGITQHIGAYYVQLPEGPICFLDTPGHEAFTAMRARGAMVTDVVILVVAADDGVMPQTKEAIAHARAASVPILVAINKIDLPAANVDNVKQQIASEGLVPEEWGGDTPVAEISALKKVGLKQLLELIHLQAELLELRANPDNNARGTIVEARLEQGMGSVATALIQDGTLEVGDAVVAGFYSGRVRALMNDHGQRIQRATPGMPVAILGLTGTPVAGDELRSVSDEKTAREFAIKLQQIRRDREMAKVAHVSLDKLFDQIQAGSVKDLNIIVKADVQGSVEAVCEALERIESEKVRLNILHRGTGSVSESDIMLASASDAIVLGFGVAVPAEVASLRDREGVDVRTYRVIYDAIEDIKKAMLGLLDDERREAVVGHLEVLKIFRSSKAGLIIGGRVTDGRLIKGARVRVVRDGRIVFDGKLATLRRFKEDVEEVPEGLECGVGIENYQDLRERDILECYQMETVAATL